MTSVITSQAQQLLGDLAHGLSAAHRAVMSRPGPIVVLFRHSIRDAIPKRREARDVPITAEGHALARVMGQGFEPTPVALWTSPMIRCVQTLESFRGSQADSLPLERSTLLGDPGPYVRDTTAVWHAYLDLGKYRMVDRLLGGTRGLKGFDAPAVGTERLLAFLAAGGGPGINQPGRPGPIVACSHDIIMATLLGHTRGRALAHEGWPRFHEAIVLRIDATVVDVYYRREHWSYAR